METFYSEFCVTCVNLTQIYADLFVRRQQKDGHSEEQQQLTQTGFRTYPGVNFTKYNRKSYS